MKKVLCVVLVVIFSLSLITISAAAEGDIRVLLNGEELNFDVPPQIIGNRTMVPMRAIFEALGFEVTWEDNFDSVELMVTATIDFFAEDDEQFDWVIDSPMIVAETNLNGITLQIESYFMLFGSYFGLRWIELDVPPQIVNNRTLVPIRAISEATGADVDWCGDSRTVVITTEIEVEEPIEEPAEEEPAVITPIVELRATVTVMALGADALANRDKEIMVGVSLYDEGVNVTPQFYFGAITIRRGAQTITGNINNQANAQDHAFHFDANWNPGQTVDVIVEVRYSTGNFVELSVMNVTIFDMAQALQNLLGPGFTIQVN